MPVSEVQDFLSSISFLGPSTLLIVYNSVRVCFGVQSISSDERDLQATSDHERIIVLLNLAATRR